MAGARDISHTAINVEWHLKPRLRISWNLSSPTLKLYATLLRTIDCTDYNSQTTNNVVKSPTAVPADTKVVNGDLESSTKKLESDKVDGLSDSVDVSLNGGSDTEATRVKALRDADGLAQSKVFATVKKPTSFKAVSVNKTFLATKGSPITALTKSGEKGGPGSSATSTTSTFSAKPRLVAKLGNGPKTSLLGGTNSVNGAPGTALAASAVWNKNQRKLREREIVNHC